MWKSIAMPNGLESRRRSSAWNPIWPGRAPSSATRRSWTARRRKWSPKPGSASPKRKRSTPTFATSSGSSASVAATQQPQGPLLPELPPLLHRPDRLDDRDVDPVGGGDVARVPALGLDLVHRLDRLSAK